MTLTADRVRELFNYDSETGTFTRRITVKGGQAGEIAGYIHNTLGYRYIGVDRKLCLAHRLAWLYIYGLLPVYEIDHINGDRSDNRISNLRDVPRVINCQNLRKARIGSASGMLGVVKNKNKWAAKIRLDGGVIHIGTYETALEAYEAYLNAKRQLHPGNTL